MESITVTRALDGTFFVTNGQHGIQQEEYAKFQKCETWQAVIVQLVEWGLGNPDIESVELRFKTSESVGIHAVSRPL